MRVLSCFDGVAGAAEAFKRADIPISQYFAFEIDKYAIQIARKNHPNIIHLGDLKNWRTLPPFEIDVIIAGFPCQAWSMAGKQEGDNDPRGALVHDLIDIWKHYKPTFFLFENVKMKKEFLEYVNNLFGVEPILINSALVSAQNRERYYWTNIPGIEQPEDKGILLKDVVECDSIKDKTKTIRVGGRNSPIDSWRCWDLFEYYERGNVKNRRYTPVECERLQGLPDGYTEGVSNTQRYKAIGNGFNIETIAHILRGLKR